MALIHFDGWGMDGGGWCQPKALYIYIKSVEMEITGIYEGIECSCPIEKLSV
jgi:hypothetical protein